MAVEMQKKIVYLPIYIFTVSREIILVNCPIVFEVFDNYIYNARGYVPQQKEDYLIVKLGSKLLVDGVPVSESEYFTDNNLSDYSFELFTTSLYKQFNYTENYISDFGWDIYKEAVILDLSIFRNSQIEYEFFTYSEEIPLPTIGFGISKTEDRTLFTDADSFTVSPFTFYPVYKQDGEIIDEQDFTITIDEPGFGTISKNAPYTFTLTMFDNTVYQDFTFLINHLPTGESRRIYMSFNP